MPSRRGAATLVSSVLDPGWLYVLAGLALCVAGVLVPARSDLDEVHAQLRRLDDANALLAARLSAYSNFLDDLADPPPDLVRRLAAAQLNQVPARSRPILVSRSTSASPTDAIDAAVAASEASIPSISAATGVSAASSASSFRSTGSPARRAAARAGRPSILSRLTDGPHRLWLLGGAVLCIFVGLIIGPGDPTPTRRAQPRAAGGGRGGVASAGVHRGRRGGPSGVSLQRRLAVEDRSGEEYDEPAIAIFRSDTPAVESEAASRDACSDQDSDLGKEKPRGDRDGATPRDARGTCCVNGNGDMAKNLMVDEAAIDVIATGTAVLAPACEECGVAMIAAPPDLEEEARMGAADVVAAAAGRVAPDVGTSQSWARAEGDSDGGGRAVCGAGGDKEEPGGDDDDEGEDEGESDEDYEGEYDDDDYDDDWDDDEDEDEDEDEDYDDEDEDYEDEDEDEDEDEEFDEEDEDEDEDEDEWDPADEEPEDEEEYDRAVVEVTSGRGSDDDDDDDDGEYEYVFEDDEVPGDEDDEYEIEYEYIDADDEADDDGR